MNKKELVEKKIRQSGDWEIEFDKMFFNPSIPSPADLKKFIKSIIKDVYVIAYKRGIQDFKDKIF